MLHPSLGPVEVQRDSAGAVSGVKFKRCLRIFDEAGRFAPQFDEEDAVVLEADTVILAIGQQPDLSFVDPGGDLRLTDRGLLECDSKTCTTTASDVFAAGDIAYGPRLLIDAVASGKRCARTVHAFLTGKPLEERHDLIQINLSDYTREADYEKLPRVKIPIISAEERKASQSVIVERGYDQSQAVTEACRCLDCGINTIFDSEKCILCGGCADVCPELCLQLVSCDRLTGDGDLDVLLRERLAGAERSDMSAIIKDEEKCIRCALCAERCPVGAITMERFQFAGTWCEANAYTAMS